MYAQFTDRARKAMQAACEEAQRFRHEYLGAEHILLGILVEGTGVAANLLNNLDIDQYKVRLEIGKIVQPGPDAVSMSKLPQTPRAKKAIKYALEEARNLNHNYLGTEHLLLGLLREGENVGAQVLMNLGLNLKDVRAEVLNLLGHAQPLEVTEDSDVPSDEIQHLPEPAREIVAEFDCQIDVVKEEKEDAVAKQEWEKAAGLRDLEYKLRGLRADFIRRWPKEI